MTSETPIVRDPPAVRDNDSIEQAMRTLLDSALPALPVIDAHSRFVGLFGERECIAAIFPAYLDLLAGAGFVCRTLDSALRCNDGAWGQPVAMYMNTEQIEVGPEFSDIQVAEKFLHHHGPIVPIVDRDQVRGVITREDFFQAAAGRFLA